MKRGDILGHEFMGEVVEVGRGVTNLAVGDRVVVPFPIACGHCAQCERDMFSLCENSNPNAWMAEKLWGYSPCGIFGYSHMLGGFAGGQAEYVRVPFADIGPMKVPAHLDDEKVLFLTDILPTGSIRSGQCHVHRYLRPLLERIERGEIDPSFVITHRMTLDEAPRGFDIFNRKQEECVKIVLKTH